MAKLRKFVAYRRIERPYTRVSKFREKSFIRTTPQIKVVMFDMGNPKKEFEYTLNLHSNALLQIRDNAIESARETANRLLEKTIGLNSYHLKVRIYPFHILRENPLATGAGADRF
ncbi:MAG: 50S ribosomal protein L16, partial [Nanoarchaeota archaeon]